MNFFVCGMNHRTAPVEVRERVAIAHQDLENSLQMILAEKGIYEAVILSTCNRCELYAFADTALRLKNWLSKNHCPHSNGIEEYLYAYEGKEAFAHSVRVASGMDSMVLGEPQIFGQMKNALSVAEELGVAGPRLSKLFQQIFAVTKKVRTETIIGENSLSVAYISMLLAKKHFHDLKDLRLLLVGAGDTIKTVAHHFYEQGARHLTIANRTLENASWGNHFNATVIALEKLPEALMQADIVITALESEKVISKNMLQNMKKASLFCVDLGVPRNIDPDVKGLPGVALYNIDDLHLVAEGSLSKRQEALNHAEEIIAKDTEKTFNKIHNQDFTTAIKDYRHKINELRESELNKALNMLHNGQSPEEVITALAYSLANKLMHHPSEQLNKASYQGQHHVLSIARELLGIGEA